MALSGSVLNEVEAILEQVGSHAVMPRFRNLTEQQKFKKKANDLVTIADLEAEALLRDALTKLVPGSLFVGEEACEHDPQLVNALGSDAPVWIVDPVDGTRNFAAGDERFCMMVGLRENGHTIAGWIHLPAERKTAIIRRGAGAFFAGERLVGSKISRVSQVRAALSLRYVPKARPIEARLDQIASNDDYLCAGHAYLDQGRGRLDAAFYWNTKPWDHVAGALLLAETGGVARYLDGSPYDPNQPNRKGLLTVADEALWQPLKEALFSDFGSGL